MRPLPSTHNPGLRTSWLGIAERKSLRLLLALGLLLLLAASAAPTLSAGPALAVDTSAQSGGAYVLTLQPAWQAQPGGYQLLPEAPVVDAAPGCCCKSCLPLVQK